MKNEISMLHVDELAEAVVDENEFFHVRRVFKGYAVPRGGVSAALALNKYLTIEWGSLEDAEFIFDDLIDSGATFNELTRVGSPGFGKPFFALIDKRRYAPDHPYRQWIVWPWEGDSVGSIEDNIRRILQHIGEDPSRGGLLETPTRVAKAWSEWCSGYSQDPADVLKTFEDGAEGVDEMVIVRDIPFYTHCEHHMAPFFGTCTIAYIPNHKIVGLSKLSRLLDIFARRLQVQERLGQQIANAIMDHLNPLGCGVILNARHLCMESRGIKKQGATTVSSALRGVFKDDPTVRAEFMALIA